MSKIKNMRVVSDDETLKHHFSFAPVAIGAIEEIDGKQYRVIDNTQTIVVTYEPVED